MLPRGSAIALLALAACARPSHRDEPPATSSLAPPPVASASAPAAAVTVPASASAFVAPPAPCEDLVRPGQVPPPIVVPRTETVRGVDVSSLAPWKALRDAGVAFGFAAATYGLTRNTAFAANWAMMKRCGLLRGAYHRLGDKGDGAAQARAFLDQLGADPGELPAVVDVEKPACEGACCGLSCAAWTRLATTFAEAVAARISRRPIIYLVAPFLDDCMCSTRALAGHPLWLAGWPKADFREAPSRSGFARWTFYQHATNVRVGGAAVDLDLFRGTAEDLARFAAGDASR